MWDDSHPAPKAADPDFERSLLKWLTDDAQMQLQAGMATTEGLHKQIGRGVEVVIGRTMAGAGDVQWSPKDKQDCGDYSETTGTLVNKTYGEEVAVVWLEPRRSSSRVVVWLDDNGRSALRNADGSLKPAVIKLVEGGTIVVGADLLLQGGEPVKQTRVVANPREFAGYTFCYNHAFFAQRTHDVLSIVNYLCKAKAGVQTAVAGWGSAGPIVAAARAVAGESIDRAVVDTCGFRFGKLLDYRDPMFLPGGAKYLDLPGMIALGAPRPLWLAGEDESPAIVTAVYRAASKTDELTTFTGEAAQKEASAAAWLLK